MRYAIDKAFHFSAAHVLAWISDEHHPCARLHGHNYKVTLGFSAEDLDHLGFVIDTHKLDFFKRYLAQRCDHQNLNQSLPSLDGQTTGERLAEHFGDTILDWLVTDALSSSERRRVVLDYVEVCETESVCATWWR